EAYRPDRAHEELHCLWSWNSRSCPQARRICGRGRYDRQRQGHGLDAQGFARPPPIRGPAGRRERPGLSKGTTRERKSMRKSLVMLAVAGVLAFSTAMTPVAFAAARTDIKVGLVLEPPNLDPTAGAAAAIDEVVYANVFEGLTRFASDGSVIPALAESWEISDDGLTYTFPLHSGVKFHDGTDMDAEDVKFSLERAMAPDSVNAQKALFADIASVEAVDPQTVRITLSKPNGNFLFNMAW